MTKNVSFFCQIKRTHLLPSETKLEEVELVVNQVFEGNAIEMSRKKTTVFTDKCSKSVTNIVENKEHEKISHPAELLNVENEMLTSETEFKEGELVVNQILDEIVGNAFQMSRKN